MYSYRKSIKKGIKYAIIIGLGIFISGFAKVYPEYAQLTIGGLLVMVYDYLKHKWGVRLP